MLTYTHISRLETKPIMQSLHHIFSFWPGLFPAEVRNISTLTQGDLGPDKKNIQNAVLSVGLFPSYTSATVKLAIYKVLERVYY